MKSTRCVGFKVQDDWYSQDPGEPNFVLEEDWITVQAANQKGVANRIRATFSATRNQLGGALLEEALRNFVVTPEFAEAEIDPDQAMQALPEFIEAYIGSERGSNLADLVRFDLALRAVAMTANVERAANPKGPSGAGSETPLWFAVNPAGLLQHQGRSRKESSYDE